MWEDVTLVDQNGNITEYEVTYNGQFDTMNQSNLIDGSMLNITIAGLEEFSNYNISVRALTSIGPGPYSGVVRSVTDEDGELIHFVYLSLKIFIKT